MVHVHLGELEQPLLLLMVNYMKRMFITLVRDTMKCSQNDVLQPFFKSRTETATNHGSLCLCHYVFYLNMELRGKFQILERLKSTAGANLVCPISRHLMVNGLWMFWWYLTTWGTLDYRSAFTRSHREHLHHHHKITRRSQGNCKIRSDTFKYT